MTSTSLRATSLRVGFRSAALGSGLLLVAGCQFGGLNSLNMPGTAGHGAGSYPITIELPDVATLPQNSPVMVDDVTVGSVSGIEAVQRTDGSFYAAVKLSLDSTVNLPANATVKVAQTSLLGSQHVQLAAPAGVAPVGRLAAGSIVPANQASRYPTTEEVLSALGIVVNKGNLGALQDITDQTYAAVAGRAGSFAGLIPQLADLTAQLNHQTSDIIAATDGLNRFSAVLARHTDALARALDSLPEALKVLNANRSHIVDAFAALKNLATVAARVLAATKDDFAADLKALYPTVKAAADNSGDLVTALQLLPTFPFPAKNVKQVVRGDYQNVFVTLDLTVRRLGESFFTTSFLDPNMAHLSEVVNAPDWLIGATANLSGQAADPFQIPPTASQGAPR
jgi:phospholipid/cholesterol/gamma-HCH transport system substrate-binding protein